MYSVFPIVFSPTPSILDTSSANSAEFAEFVQVAVVLRALLS